MEPHKRRTLSRAIVGPLVILLVAGGLGLWGVRREGRRQAEIETYARVLVVSGSSDPAWPPGLDDALASMRGAAAFDPGRLTIQVQPVDPRAGGPGTHTAVVELDDGQRLGLRLAWREEGEIAIVGFWHD